MLLVFQRFTKCESLLPYQPLPLRCLTTHSFLCRSSCIGVVHPSLDGSSLFAVSPSLMCASSQKRDAEILLSHRPSGSADFLEFLKGRVFHYVSSGQAVIWVYKHFSKLDNLNCRVLKCKACKTSSDLNYLTVLVLASCICTGGGYVCLTLVLWTRARHDCACAGCTGLHAHSASQ